MITAKKQGVLTKALLALTISTSATALLVPGMALAADNETPNADKSGFLAGSSLNLLNRNMFVNKEFRNNAADEQSYQQEWAHGINTEFESGYTEGVIGFGLDAHIYAGFKLDTGDGTNGWGLLPVDEDGHADDQYAELGGAVKMRISATELKYGNLRPNNPMLATGDQALDPETATGFHLISNEVDGLTVEAGHFTAYNNVGSSNSDDELESNYGGGKAGESLDLGGATYAINDQLTVTGYLSQYKETWDQYYANANYTIPLSEEQSLNFDVNVYRTNDTGDALQGEINNTSYSAAAAYSMGEHTFTMAYQTIHGDTPFDYIGHNSIALNNAMQLSDFNAPNEKSFRLGYDYDMSNCGLPGMALSATYGRGDNIDGTHADINGGYADLYGNGGSHWERDFTVKYIVQNGPAKDLSIRLLQSLDFPDLTRHLVALESNSTRGVYVRQAVY